MSETFSYYGQHSFEFQIKNILWLLAQHTVLSLKQTWTMGSR